MTFFVYQTEVKLLIQHFGEYTLPKVCWAT